MLTLLKRRPIAESQIDRIHRDGLPEFDSAGGEKLRRGLLALADKSVLNKIVDVAETSWQVKWLRWLDSQVCKAYPGNVDLLCRWICHEIAFGNAAAVRMLRVILFSLPHDPDSPSILNAKARLGYFSGDIEAGDAALRALEDLHPEYDRTWVKAERINALVRDENWSELGSSVDELLKTHTDDGNIATLALRAYAEAGDNTKVVSLVDGQGGPSSILQEYTAFLFLSALELTGQKARCLSDGITILERHPDFFSLYFMLRSVAHSLDVANRLEPVFETAVRLFPRDPRVIEIQCLAALDKDDFDEVERLMAMFEDKRSESYLRFNLTYLTTRPGATGALEAYEAYRATSVPHVGPEVQYAGYLLGTASDLYALVQAHDILASQKENGAKNPGFVRMMVQTLVAMGREDDARSYFDTVPPSAKTATQLREVSAFLAQSNGDHDEANSIWRELARSGAYRAVTNSSQLPERVTFNYDAARDQILAFACVFNAIEYADWFLDYYRKLGVDHVFVVDNGSTDGTKDVFASQPDVSVFSQTGSFKDSAHGVYWINHLMRTYAQGKWAFFVDMDEAFVFPGMDRGRTLKDLLRYCDENGFAALPSFMLDVFPATDTADFIAPSCFDNNYFAFPSIRAPYRTVQGGFRSRLTNRNFLITKSPLVKVSEDFYFLENNHTHTHLPVADIETSLIHYKFIGDAQSRFAEAVERQQHFMGARFYKDLTRSINGSDYERTECSLTFEGASQLEELGLIRGSDAWTNFQ